MNSVMLFLLVRPQSEAATATPRLPRSGLSARQLLLADMKLLVTGRGSGARGAPARRDQEGDSTTRKQQTLTQEECFQEKITNIFPPLCHDLYSRLPKRPRVCARRCWPFWAASGLVEDSENSAKVTDVNNVSPEGKIYI